MHILCDAIPFCYGPASALKTLVSELHARRPGQYAFDVLASGTTLEFLRRANDLTRLIAVNTEEPSALDQLSVGDYDAFIAVCNPVSYNKLGSALPTAYVDFLLWMHSGPPAPHFKSDLYVAERYPGTDEWVRMRGDEIRNLVIVPPLVQRIQRRPVSGTLLVGLGGLVSRLTVPGVNTNYHRIVIKQILEALPAGRFNQIRVACSELAAQELALEFPDAEFVSLSHDRFLQELAHSEVFVTHPGLYAPFEAMSAGIPTAFLPPSNYTQVLQIHRFRTARLAPYSFAWEDCGAQPVPEGLPEEEGVHLTLAQIHWAEEHVEARDGLRDMLQRFFRASAEDLAILGAAQQEAVRCYGTDGPKEASWAVAQWLDSLECRNTSHD